MAVNINVTVIAHLILMLLVMPRKLKGYPAMMTTARDMLPVPVRKAWQPPMVARATMLTPAGQPAKRLMRTIVATVLRHKHLTAVLLIGRIVRANAKQPIKTIAVTGLRLARPMVAKVPFQTAPPNARQRIKTTVAIERRSLRLTAVNLPGAIARASAGLPSRPVK